MTGDSPPTNHKPYVPDDSDMAEFTGSAVLVGAILGIVFGASSLYLVLKVGMTVSASIPVAVLSITLFRFLADRFGWRRATILENNVVQTTGSAGESIAFGVGVTMPALMLLGFDMTVVRVMVVAVLGGLLGILMMIPLRRAFIVKLHGKPGEAGKLLYPEGTACAQVLMAGEKGGTSGTTVFVGFGVAFIHKFVTEGMGLLVATVKVPVTAISNAAVFAGEMASELLGVGYIIGLRTSAVMMAGAILGYLVIIPTIAIMGSGDTIIPPGDKPIRRMELGEIRNAYLLFIGAGCVAAAGIMSMIRTLPMIVRSFGTSLGSLTRRGSNSVAPTNQETPRTENDLSPRFVMLGGLGLLVLLAMFLATEVGALAGSMGSILVLAFGFLFVTVSSRLTGEIGSSSNPISGMTVATLTLTCLIFLALGMTSPTERVLALSIGAVVCIAASNGGTTSQDLKTGFLVGGTPKLQQYAILIGALTSALVIGGTLLLFDAAGTVYSKKERYLPTNNLKDQLPQLKETTSYEGTTYHVWRPTKEEADTIPRAKPGKYLVDETGKVCYIVDPGITGRLTRHDRDEQYVPLADTNVNERDIHTVVAKVNLKDKLLKDLPDTETVDGKKYHLWRPDKESYPQNEKYTYLVDEQGTVRYLLQGQEVKLKFDAPKTQVMGLIINGVLKRDLNWSMVLIGAMIAITLELCGVSSLAFAVGVYVPIQYSTPIFLGGILRWAVDKWFTSAPRAMPSDSGDAAAAAQAEVTAIAKTETSPGVLLASGYIAGGSLAGVSLAFLEFAPALKDALNYSDVSKSLGDAGALSAFALLLGLLLIVGAGKLFAGPADAEGTQNPGNPDPTVYS